MLIINGTFIQALPTVEGDSQRGHWVRGGFVIEYGDDFPRKVAFTCFGEDKVAQSQSIPQGCPVQVDFRPESREFNGRYYTELSCSHITLLAQQQPQMQYAGQPQQYVMPQQAYGQPMQAPMPQQQQPVNTYRTMPSGINPAPAPQYPANPAPAPQQQPLSAGANTQQPAPVQMPAQKDDDLPF